MLLAALLTAQLVSATPVPRGLIAATVVAQNRGVSLADREPQHRKSFNILIGALELGVAAAGAYVGVLTGIIANIPLGAMSWPPDRNDILLLGALPAAMAAIAGWLVGLLDLSQRSLIGSLLWALVGGVVGEAGGLCAGYAIGRGVAPGDFAASASIAVLIAPAFAAFGAVLFMELFKPGEVIASASLLPVRDGRGLIGFVPAVAVRF